MCKFSIGFISGAVLGAGMLMAINPMDKRSMRRACRRAERMAHKLSNSVNDWAI